MSDTPAVERAIASLLGRLEPLREAGITCRRLADTKAAGYSEQNGTITLVYTGDRAFSYSASMGGATQEFLSDFTFVGRLRNLRLDGGMARMRDYLYSLTAGVDVPGYHRPTQVKEFQPTSPEQGKDGTFWGFQYVLSAPGRLVYCDDREMLGAGDGPRLKELLFAGTVNDVVVTDG